MGLGRRRSGESGGRDADRVDDAAGTRTADDGPEPAEPGAGPPVTDAPDPAARAPRPAGASAPWSDGLGRAGTRSVQVLAILALVAVAVFVVTRLTLRVSAGLIALRLAAALSPPICPRRPRR